MDHSSPMECYPRVVCSGATGRRVGDGDARRPHTGNPSISQAERRAMRGRTGPWIANAVIGARCQQITANGIASISATCTQGGYRGSTVRRCSQVFRTSPCLALDTRVVGVTSLSTTWPERCREANNPGNRRFQTSPRGASGVAVPCVRSCWVFRSPRAFRAFQASRSPLSIRSIRARVEASLVVVCTRYRLVVPTM